jgi:L-asparaginase/Glu-tRNA(Gln) amidotransferase subunit D
MNLPVQTVQDWEERTRASQKKILVLSLGGTIVSHMNPQGTYEPHPQPLDLFKEHTSIHEMADLDFKLVANVDSTNMKSKYWISVVQYIADEQDNYDGILITHGTDTMAHTAAALRFLLGDNLRIPVVLTGSQLPLNAGDRSDGPANLGDSIETLIAGRNEGINEVMIVFGHKILRGNRAVKVSELDYVAFESPAYPELAPINSGNVSFKRSPFVSRVDMNGLSQDSPLPKIEITDGFGPTPLEIAVNPDFEITEGLKEAFKNEAYKGIIMRSFGAGNIPDDLISAIEELNAIGIPVLIGVSYPGAGMNPKYVVGDAPIKAGAIPTGNMLTHTALIKLRMLQNKGLSLEEIKQEMPKDYYGEVG